MSSNEIIISILSGLIGVVLSVFFMYKIQNKKIKKDIEIRTANELNDLVKKCHSLISSYTIQLWEDRLNEYNNFYEVYEESISETEGSSTLKEELYKKLISLNDADSKNNDAYFAMSSGILEVLGFIQLHCLILNKFVPFYDSIMKKYNELKTLQSQLYDSTNVIIKDMIKKPRRITDAEIQLTKLKIGDIIKCKNMIFNYCSDLIMEVQNVFLGNLFRMNIKHFFKKYKVKRKTTGDRLSASEYPRSIIEIN